MEELRLAQVVGDNVRAVREDEKGWRQDDLARRARAIGLDWTRSVVANLESGLRRGVDLGEVLILATILEVPIERLLRTSRTDRVRVQDLFVPADQLVAMATGTATRREAFWDETEPILPPVRSEHLELAERYGFVGTEAVGPVLARLGDPEEKASRAMKLVPRPSPEEVVLAAMSLWGTTLGEKRDEAIPADADRKTQAGLRGHATRQLVKDLKVHIEEVRARTADPA